MENLSKKDKPEKKEILTFDTSLFFTMMFEHAEYTGILIMDPQGLILDANYGFNKCFGYSKESLAGKNFSILFTESDIKKNLPERELKGVLENGSFNDENYLKQADGSSTWVKGESIYAQDDKGQEFVLKVVQDINEEKILGVELKKINEVQERVINDRETFIYAASHDLQSPINNIEGLVNALKEKNDPEESKLLLAMMEKSIQRFRNKIQELSEIGKEKEEGKMDSGETEFQETFGEILLDLEEEIRSSGGEIVSDFTQVSTVKFPPRNLKSILQNLISNTVKYRSPDRELKVRVETKKIKDDYTLLSVQDNGIGIMDEDKDKVFRMYQRLHKDSKGTGVGMAIVKRIVDNAGGKIELESEIGKGTTVKIYFLS